MSLLRTISILVSLWKIRKHYLCIDSILLSTTQDSAIATACRGLLCMMMLLVCLKTHGWKHSYKSLYHLPYHSSTLAKYTELAVPTVNVRDVVFILLQLLPCTLLWTCRVWLILVLPTIVGSSYSPLTRTLFHAIYKCLKFSLLWTLF